MVAASACILPKRRPCTPRVCTALALRQAYSTAPGGSVRVSTCRPCVPLCTLASRPAPPLADSRPKLMLCVCCCLHPTVDMHSLVCISAGFLCPGRQPERQAAAGHPGALLLWCFCFRIGLSSCGGAAMGLLSGGLPSCRVPASVLRLTECGVAAVHMTHPGTSPLPVAAVPHCARPAGGVQQPERWPGVHHRPQAQDDHCESRWQGLQTAAPEMAAAVPNPPASCCPRAACRDCPRVPPGCVADAAPAHLLLCLRGSAGQHPIRSSRPCPCLAATHRRPGTKRAG